MKVICLGLSHRTAEVGLREQFAIASTNLANAAHELRSLAPLEEAVIISTCNRVELYAATEDAGLGITTLQRYLAGRGSGTPPTPEAFYELSESESVRHLFRVVSGLESMVLGETEVLGQVKTAYAHATDGGATGRHLNKLFQRAFHVAKEVRTQTNITRGAVSIGSVAVELAEKIFGNLSACQVMILGAGETAELTARALFSRGLRSIFVSNRRHERAEALAGELGGRAIHFGEWTSPFQEIDILIGSTSAPHPVLTRAALEPLRQSRRDKPLFIIDLAVPRDIDPTVNALEGVYLYDIDSLQSIAQQSLEYRRQDLARCEEIIERHVQEYARWLVASHPAPARIVEPGLAVS